MMVHVNVWFAVLTCTFKARGASHKNFRVPLIQTVIFFFFLHLTGTNLGFIHSICFYYLYKIKWNNIIGEMVVLIIVNFHTILTCVVNGMIVRLWQSLNISRAPTKIPIIALHTICEL